jgi:predicted phage-related endonuclease
MTITYHKNMMQNSQEWLDARCGLLTASEFSKIVTSKGLTFAANETCRTHMYQLLAQRITKHVEPQFQSYDMMRGHADEIEARELYARHYAPVEQCGFITNDDFGFTLGFSPDGLVGDDGIIEIKSRAQKFQMRTIIEGEAPDEFMVQMQLGLLVSGRKWCDFISYCGGLPMFTKRVHVDEGIRGQLVAAAAEFEQRMDQLIIDFAAKLEAKPIHLIPTERKEYDIGGTL